MNNWQMIIALIGIMGVVVYTVAADNRSADRDSKQDDRIEQCFEKNNEVLVKVEKLDTKLDMLLEYATEENPYRMKRAKEKVDGNDSIPADST